MERRSMSTWTAEAAKTGEFARSSQPLVFPEEAEVPESKRHLALRTVLFSFLERAFGDRAAIGSEQFVYFDATDPRRCVAPDAFVRLGAENDSFATWKVWERGAPDVAVELSSPNERPWSDKLADYRAIGVRELVRFDADAPPGERLEVWDRVEEDLVPRVVEGDRAASHVLGGTWCVGPGAGYGVALRLEDAGGVFFPTEAEAERAAKEVERARADALEAKLAALLAARDRSGS
jgi:hypothetical protein